VWPRAKSARKTPFPSRRTGFVTCKENVFAEGLWWSWGDLNPRPQAIFEQIYMFSGLI
jgi:hypothetical protein